MGRQRRYPRPTPRKLYHYQELQIGEIRLLRLLPGLFGAPLRCNLDIEQLASHDASNSRSRTIAQRLPREVCPKQSILGDPREATGRHWANWPSHPDQYEAISYAWGDPTLTEDLEVVGGGFIRITRSLSESLRYFRYLDRHRSLWADAVCINQHDREERGKQVAQMARVYYLADRVLVWLGPRLLPRFAQVYNPVQAFAALQRLQDAEAEAQSGADQTLRLATSKHCACCGELAFRTDEEAAYDSLSEYAFDRSDDILAEGTPLLSSDSEDEAQEYEDGNHIPSDALDAICCITMQPWFHRLWTAQEICLGRESQLCCGYHHVNWRQLVTACNTLDFGSRPMELDSLERGSHHDLLRFRDEIVAWPKRFLTAAFLFRKRKCSDPRDHVFAFRGLCHAVDTALMSPDYTTSPAEIFRRTAEAILTFGDARDSSLLLALARPARSSSRYENSLPSWVPDFDALPDRGDFARHRRHEVCFDKPVTESAICWSDPKRKSVALKQSEVGSVQALLRRSSALHNNPFVDAAENTLESEIFDEQPADLIGLFFNIRDWFLSCWPSHHKQRALHRSLSSSPWYSIYTFVRNHFGALSPLNFKKLLWAYDESIDPDVAILTDFKHPPRRNASVTEILRWAIQVNPTQLKLSPTHWAAFDRETTCLAVIRTSDGRNLVGWVLGCCEEGDLICALNFSPFPFVIRRDAETGDSRLCGTAWLLNSPDMRDDPAVKRNGYAWLNVC